MHYVKWLQSSKPVTWKIYLDFYPDSKVHGANMGLIWGRQAYDLMCKMASQPWQNISNGKLCET